MSQAFQQVSSVPMWQAPLPLRVPAIRARPLRSLVPLLAVFYSFLFLPPEVQITIFSVNLPSYRIAVLATLVPSLWILLRGRAVANPVDYFVLLMGFWMLVSFMVTYGFERGFVRGTGLLIDTTLAYLVARASVKTPDELRRFLLLCLPGILFAGSIMVVESVSGSLLLRPFFASQFGYLAQYSGGEATGTLVLQEEFRLGLLRAYGPFPHPILGGAIMAAFLPIYYFSGLRSWPYLLGVAICFTAFFSLSSAAYLGLMIAVGAITVQSLKPYFPRISWEAIIGLLGMLVMVLHVASDNGIISLVSRLTLTPHTADYRRLIWEFGMINVAQNPFFGIGYQQWERLRWMIGDSVDAHFLLLAMRHGLPVAIFLLVAMGYGMVRLSRAMPSMSVRDRFFMTGLNMSLFVYLIVGQTVNYFASAGLVFMSFIGFLAAMVEWAIREQRMQTQLRLMIHRSRLAQAAS